jgi:hypothetical protein
MLRKLGQGNLVVKMIQDIRDALLYRAGVASDQTTALMMEKSLMEMPLRSMKMATGMTNRKIDGIAALANGQFFRGIRMLLSK